jgi:hypothetical protein
MVQNTGQTNHARVFGGVHERAEPFAGIIAHLWSWDERVEVVVADGLASQGKDSLEIHVREVVLHRDHDVARVSAHDDVGHVFTH